MRKLAILLAVLAAVAGCGNLEVSVRTPDVFPVSFSLTVGENKVEVKGEVSLVTPLGEVAIGLQFTEPLRPDTTRVVFRDYRRGTDQGFDLRTAGDEFHAVLEGKAPLTARPHEITIDITNATLSEVGFRQTEASHDLANSWWANTFYHPFDGFRLVYDDSGIGSSPPLGFLVFVLRLILAILLGILELYPSAVFVIGWLVSLVAGNAGGNAATGLVVLATLVAIGALLTARGKKKTAVREQRWAEWERRNVW
ncbi:hypothetical protein [Actinokineospora cianjurensis]|uniref:Lipoprotein n=1 Tax=Actinokineospora cianjurensis TaxID=585224 RepID=A0A421BCV3_9PSEU|nr:hypothetical protein [Actinokineospora cianjurensis]RLK62215.1 hypothetical protein CLV68_2771 [Actinokineospora cianjurensis]